MQPSQNYPLFMAGITAFALLVITGFNNNVSVYTADVVQTQKFELIDDKGRVRASIRVEDTGETVFRLMDGNGDIRVKLGASKEGSGIVLLDDSTSPGIHGLARKGGGTLTLMGKDGRTKQLTP